MLEDKAPEENFEEEKKVFTVVVSEDTKPVTVEYFLGELEKWKRPGVSVEVWGNKEDDQPTDTGEDIA